MTRALTGLLTIAILAGPTLPEPAEGQVWKKVKQAVKSETNRAVDRGTRKVIRGAVRCAFDDLECIEAAEGDGDDVVLTDEDGNDLNDESGEPIRDPGRAADKASARPGEGAWANYDFIPGERLLFAEDLASDEVGDFPKRLEFVRGGMEVVEWEGRRLLRVASRDSRFGVALPETLPEQFTIEFDAFVGHPNAPIIVTTYVPDDRRMAHVQDERPYFFFDGARGHTSGLHSHGKGLAGAADVRIADEIVTVRVMVDGSHAKVYVNERRLANHPQVLLERSDRVYFSFPTIWTDRPVLVGNIRIAAGGRDLYDKLTNEGRVATRGIFFDTGSARIRPESTPTLDEIGRMLEEHADLSIRIEGHTDDVGEDDFNLELSRMRAASVRRFLTGRYAIDESRLEAEGFGETRPVDTNETPEGRQQNRRVELVRVGGAGAASVPG